MSALAVSAIIFLSTLGGIFLGALLRRTLPKHHLNEHAKDVVRLGAGLIATIAALVLGLLIAAAKGSFDTQSTHLKHITADLILLDNILAQYGPEARPIREEMRSTVGPFADQLWREKEAVRAARLKRTARRNGWIWTSRSCHRRTLSSVRSKRAQCRSATISRKCVFCCLPNPKIAFQARFSQFWHFGSWLYLQASACSHLSTRRSSLAFRCLLCRRRAQFS